MNATHRHNSIGLRRTGRAFTLVELLTVLGIMIIVLAIAVPSMNALFNSGRIEAATNAINVAVASARSYAGVQPAEVFDADPNSPADGSFSGVAILFTPANEMRLVKNIAYARDGLGRLLEIPVPNPVRNGYADIEERDYIPLPRSAGVMGIVRDSTGLRYLPPPFAVSFNEHGNLVNFGDADHSSNQEYQKFLVYYNGDYNDYFDVDEERDDLAYIVAEWDPDSPDYAPGTNDNEPGIDEDENKHRLPFEAVETVVGLYVYDKAPLRDAVDATDLEGPGFRPGDPVGDWLENNAQLLMFNQYTGNVIQVTP